MQLQSFKFESMFQSTSYQAVLKWTYQVCYQGRITTSTTVANINYYKFVKSIKTRRDNQWIAIDILQFIPNIVYIIILFQMTNFESISTSGRKPVELNADGLLGGLKGRFVRSQESTT